MPDSILLNIEGWVGELNGDLSLSPLDRKMYERVIKGYLGYVSHGNGKISKETAKEYVEAKFEKEDPRREPLRWLLRRFSGGEEKLGKGADWEEKLRECLRVGQYSYRTEVSYRDWVRSFMNYWKEPDLSDLDSSHLEKYLTYLAVERAVRPNTQKQALNGILFFYRHVLQVEPGDIGKFRRAKASKKMPVVLTTDEIQMMLDELDGNHLLMAQIMYGAGLRVSEVVRLRVMNMDVARRTITVVMGKGEKDRVLPMPRSIEKSVSRQMRRLKNLFEEDRKNKVDQVYLPGAVGRKFSNMSQEFSWQYFFPSRKLSKDPRSDKVRRHHLQESTIQDFVRDVAKRVGIHKRVTPHVFRHSFATHLLEAGESIHRVQELLGHEDLKTTEIYLHLMSPVSDTITPLDRLMKRGDAEF